MVNGWIIVDKPAGLTSTKVGSILKKLSKTKRIGHIGTLDPFATGVLPLAIGEATKIIPYVNTDIKEYEFEITFGMARDTGDVTGQIIADSDVRPTIESLQLSLKNFIGHIMQIPPVYSAVRINGERAYDLARQGIVPQLKERAVKIYELELIHANLPSSACFRVVCSAGTYVRTLGQDLAACMGTFGYLSVLRRTKVGKFTLGHSFSLDKLSQAVHIIQDSLYVLPIRNVLDDILALPVSADDERKIRQGQAILLDINSFVSSSCLLLNDKGEVGLCEVTEGKFAKMLSPIRVFNFSK